MKADGEPEIRIFADQHQLAETAAHEFEAAAARYASAGRRLHAALSGGSTPALFFRNLARKDIGWDLVHFYWGDERCVPPDHPESNYLMTRRELLDLVGIPESNIHRIRGEDDPAGEAGRYAGEISGAVPAGSGGIPVFDWIFLGLGTDGHTASIFPGSVLQPDPSGLCAVGRHPVTGQLRITLTLPVINNAARVSFLAAGGGKAGVVGEILGRRGAFREYPASRVRPLEGTLEWFLDREAAGELTISD